MDQPIFDFQRLPAPPAIIEVWANERTPAPVSRRLYGKFTEHLVRNVNRGMWAQILANPGFEPGERLASDPGKLPGQLRGEAGNVARSEPAGLYDGVAPYWEPAGDARCELITGGVSGTAQRVEARAGGGGVRQAICLPLHRVGRFELTVWVRGGGAPVRFAVEDAEGRVLGRSGEVRSTPEWRQERLALHVDAKGVPRGAPLTFTATLAGPGRVDLDACLLFPADHVGGFDPDVVAHLRAMRLPLLRWPGGNFVSGYRWQEAIGPVERRPTRPNPAWNVPEYHHLGTDEFLALCREVGCEPLICVNAGDGTPEEAAAWVEYCNGGPETRWGALRARNGHPEPYGVRLWEVGNEIYGGWQVGHCTAEEYARRYAAFAKVMLAADPAIQLIACGHNAKWNAPLVAQKEQPVRSLSVHSLPGGHIPAAAPPLAVWREAMAWPVAYERELRALGRQMGEAGLAPRLAITELQLFTNKRELPNNTNLAEALFLAGVLHTAIRQGDLVEMITHSALVNHAGGLGKHREVVFTHPVQWTSLLYSTTPGRWPLRVRVAGEGYDCPGEWLPAVKDVPLLDALALADDAGRVVSLMVINRDPERALKATLRLHDFPVRAAKVRVLTAPGFMARNEWDRPDVVGLREAAVAVTAGDLTHEFPAHSVTELVFER